MGCAPRRCTCLLALPPGQYATWAAHQTTDGLYYYHNFRTNEKTWALPQAPASNSCTWIEPGALVRIVGGSSSDLPRELERYNDQAGTVVYVSEGAGQAVGVKLPDIFGDFILEVPRANVCPPRENTIKDYKPIWST